MDKFNDFMFKKSLNGLAERCVREKLPIVEFVSWYEKEGIYLETGSGFLNNVAGGALAGGGYGSWGGVPGAAIGAGLGALAGAGKYLWSRYKNNNTTYDTTKQQALEALDKLEKLTPNKNFKDEIFKIVNMLSKQNDQKDQVEPEPDAYGSGI